MDDDIMDKLLKDASTKNFIATPAVNTFVTDMAGFGIPFIAYMKKVPEDYEGIKFKEIALSLFCLSVITMVCKDLDMQMRVCNFISKQTEKMDKAVNK